MASQETDTRHEFDSLPGDDVCVYLLGNGERCMKFEGDHDYRRTT